MESRELEPLAIRDASPEERSQYYYQLARVCGDDRIWTHGERDHLPNVMRPGELLLFTSSGFLKSTGKEGKSGGTALICLTDRRILILDKRLFSGVQTISIDLDKVNSITGDTGLFFGGFKIQDGGDERDVGTVNNASVLPFVERVQEAIEARKRELQRVVVTEGPPPDDFISQLERLADLRERGILTDAEFAAQKARILNS